MKLLVCIFQIIVLIIVSPFLLLLAFTSAFISKLIVMLFGVVTGVIKLGEMKILSKDGATNE